MDLWLCQNFIVPQKTPVKTNSQDFWKVAIKSLRDSLLTCITFENEIMFIYSENINLTADIVQSLASYLNLDQIEVSQKLLFFIYYYLLIYIVYIFDYNYF